MNSRKFVIAFFSVFLAAAIACSMAYADDWDQAMKLTFSQPIAIPGQVLPAGTYWFVLPGHGDEINTMQVFDESRKNVLATLHTGTEEIVKASGHITVSLADRTPHPEALLSLIYPGRTDGHQFELVYSTQERKQFSEFPKITMRVGDKGYMERVTDETR